MAGTEDPKIPPHTERPQSLSHAKIIESFEPVGVDPSFGAVGVFRQAKTDWDVGLATFRQRMHAAISEAWEGNAAEASKSAISAYTTKAAELSPTFETVANLISVSATSSSETKSTLPPRKDDPGFWDINDRWLNNDEFEAGRADDEEDARAIMEAKYVNAFKIVDAGLPVLDHPTSLVTESFVPGGDSNNDDGDGGGGSKGGDDDEDGGTGEDPDTEIEEEDTAEDDTSDDDSDDDSTEEDTTEDDGVEDDTTSDDDTAAASTETPATTPGTTTPNSPGSTGSPTGSSPSAGAPGAAVSTPGRIVAGVPAAAGISTAATGSAAGSAGRGMTGAPGMMGAGGGRGGGKDDENTHEIPDYLINEENTRELIGETAKATPQAIGAKFIAAQTRPAEPEGESK